VHNSGGYFTKGINICINAIVLTICLVVYPIGSIISILLHIQDYNVGMSALKSVCNIAFDIMDVFYSMHV